MVTCVGWNHNINCDCKWGDPVWDREVFFKKEWVIKDKEERAKERACAEKEQQEHEWALEAARGRDLHGYGGPVLLPPLQQPRLEGPTQTFNLTPTQVNPVDPVLVPSFPSPVYHSHFSSTRVGSHSSDPPSSPPRLAPCGCCGAIMPLQVEQFEHAHVLLHRRINNLIMLMQAVLIVVASTIIFVLGFVMGGVNSH